MGNMFSKVREISTKPIVRASLALAAGLGFSITAHAAGGGITAGLCYIVEQYKLVVGTVALIAVLVAVVNSFFSKNSLIADIVLIVLIGCGIAAAAGTFVTSAGLTVSCS